MKLIKERNGNGIEALTKKIEKGSMKREKYIDKLTEQLKEWDKELKELEHKAGGKFTDIKSKFAQRLEKTKKKRDQLRNKLNKFEKAGEEVSKDIKNDFEILWNDIKDGIKNMRKQLK